ncbi:diguanylate cyclase domain-containing protein [Alteromonas sp. CYL-A6]|uniref:diguanylate cyclase domain-containing protein n=1 Tax=Alteromonas nitratireducens TaxID=3390813 RepID=UPI0034C1DFD0
MTQESKLRQIIHIQTEIAKHGLDLAKVLEYVVQCTPDLLDADGAAIELAEGDEMVYRAASGMAKQFLGLRLKISESLSGRSYREGAVFLSNDAMNDERVNRAACEAIGLRAMLVYPLKHAGKVIGVFKAMSCRVNAFDDNDMELIELLSDVVAASMYFSSVYSKDALFIRATQDSLTGLANRSVYMDRLRMELNASKQSDKHLAVVIFDMDNLKPVNDEFGHLAGDALLKGFALRLKSASRHSDVVARIGGDEFALLLKPIDGKAQVETAIERISQRLDTSVSFHSHVFPIECSVGCALYPDDGDSVDVLMHKADARMYENKRAKKEALESD